jgi:holliday junction DNA helicase RuvA
MIAFIRGIIIHIEEDSVILDTQGIGYRVFCIPRDIPELVKLRGNEQTFYTYQYIRENAMELYGFRTRDEEQMFQTLIGISGIGPKGAMGVLSAAPLDVLRRAIASGDMGVLTRISGIGKKIAQKIMVELKDKFSQDWGGAPEDIQEETDVVEALMGLGYSRPEAQQAVGRIGQDLPSVEAKIKAALKFLGKG